jgi:hypothetical protein
MSTLPKSFKLDDPVPALPEGSNSVLVSCRPVTSGALGASAVVDVDLGNRGWLEPKSLSIRYTMAITQGAGSSAMIGTPAFTPFQRLQITANGTTIDSISQYNQVCHVLTQGKLDVAQKFGRQYAYGFTPATTASVSNMDGRVSTANDKVFSVSAQLPCILSESEKMLPLFAMGGVRLTFSLDVVSNMFMSADTYEAVYILPTAISITNFEVCYNQIDLGREVEMMVRGMGSRLFIKTHSYNNSATSIPAGLIGSNSYVFNQRYSSIRSAYMLPNLTIANKWAEICDITATSTTVCGDYQLICGNSAYPQMPLSSINNKAGILNETYRAFKAIDEFGSMSIDTNEFTRLPVVTLTTYSNSEPGKFILGLNLEKVQTADHVLMSGVSTYNTPLSVVVNCPALSVVAANLNLLLDYDAILVIDQEAGQVSVRS